MALFRRIWMVVVAVNLIILTVFVGLAALQFDAIHSSLLGERLALLAARTVMPFEQAARIGLPLSMVRNADGLLERARQTDDAIASIHVFDPGGRILHSTDRSAPAAIPPAALAARAGAGGAPWYVATGDGFLSGIEIASRTGANLGGVLIVYSAAQHAARVGAMGAELILAGIAVLLGSIGLGAVLLRLGLRRQIRDFDGIERAIRGFERDAWRTAAAAPPGTPLDEADGEMRGLLDESEDMYRATGHALAQAQSQA